MGCWWHREKMHERLPLSRALLWIFLSTLIVSGSATLGWLYYLHVIYQRVADDDYTITTIVPTTLSKDALATSYLAELLGLSVDIPQNLYAFDFKAARSRLLKSPLIKDVIVKRMPPSALHVDYSIRQPIAYSGDYDNTAIDEEGYPLPFRPFFSPRGLPEIYLGLPAFGTEGVNWNHPLRGDEARLALELWRILTSDEDFMKMVIKKIDVSEAYANSYGQREIIVIAEDLVEVNQCIIAWMLRLSTNRYLQELSNFKVLRTYQMEKQLTTDEAVVRVTMVLDLRIPQLAFVQQLSTRGER